jgi:alpha-L-fucosidase
MKMKKIVTAFFAIILFCCAAKAQKNEAGYIYPTDPLVQQKLDHWQDLKFGFIIHWGLYSVPGIMESWTLCSEDLDWIKRDTSMSYCDYKKWYWGLSKEFAPTGYNPDAWASMAKDAGMKYVVFTTKHHEGFSMFDTKQSDFSIAKGAFKNDPRKDVARYVFEAFRKQNFMIGDYFSKPDWHSNYYWWDYFATPNRNVNYSIKKHPERWQKFKDFTFNQINEITSNYGSIDILWLDGGQVRPPAQDIDMPKIAAMARKNQPGLLIVDRTVHGKYENYQTPEGEVPHEQLNYPWETCMTIGNGWGYKKNYKLKPIDSVVHLLIEIVAKGGNLLLGTGPDGKGNFHQEDIDAFKTIGKWMQKNGSAIYATRTTPDYHQGNIWFNVSKDHKIMNAIYCIDKKKGIPASVSWNGNAPKRGAKMKLLETGKYVKWKKEGDKIVVQVPENMSVDAMALAFQYQYQ